MDRAMEALGGQRKFAIAAARSLNKVGGKARTQVRRNLTAQTGLKRAVIVRAVRDLPASPGRLRHELSSTGGDVALKYFSAKEFSKGVKAKPFGQWKMFEGVFIRAGAFPNRVATAKFGGHAMKRAGSGKWPVERQKSGVVIPAEMVKGATAASWRTVVDTDLPARLIHDLSRVSGRVFS
ncbi:MAG TPA: hypothetical protein DCX34_03550 [Roseovarius sp.]|nr:hypothetical protein [Roseovarius sp.]